jgi:hypothetical protein
LNTNGSMTFGFYLVDKYMYARRVLKNKPFINIP